MDSAIGDRECAEAVLLDRGQLFMREIFFERFNEFSMIHQLHLRTRLEEAWIVCEDISCPFIAATPSKDALVVGRTDNLQLKTMERLLPLTIQHRHVYIQKSHQ